MTFKKVSNTMESIKMMLKSKRNPIYCVYKHLFFLYGKKYPMWLANRQYKKNFGRPINWEHPTEMNEKIRWMQFYTDTSRWTELADKYKVREFLIEKGYGDILIPLLGMWNDAREIDFTKLPDSFVLKTNHGCGDVFVIKDKSTADLKKIRRKIQYYLRTPFGYANAEHHYLGIPPCIIAEKLLLNDSSFSSSMVDYKFYCVGGEPYCCAVFYDRDPVTHHTNSTFYDMQWKRHDEWRASHIVTPPKDIPCPTTLDHMIQACRDLASEFPFVRLDFYESQGKLYFGEFTFTPAALSGGSLSKDICMTIGSMINLEAITA